jgi:hypothetical protein
VLNLNPFQMTFSTVVNLYLTARQRRIRNRLRIGILAHVTSCVFSESRMR